MKQQVLTEFYRKLIHFSSVILPTGYMFIIKDQILMILILAFLSLFSVIVELLRNKVYRFKKLFNLTLKKY